MGMGNWWVTIKRGALQLLGRAVSQYVMYLSRVFFSVEPTLPTVYGIYIMPGRWYLLKEFACDKLFAMCVVRIWTWECGFLIAIRFRYAFRSAAHYVNIHMLTIRMQRLPCWLQQRGKFISVISPTLGLDEVAQSRRHRDLSHEVPTNFIFIRRFSPLSGPGKHFSCERWSFIGPFLRLVLRELWFCTVSLRMVVIHWFISSIGFAKTCSAVLAPKGNCKIQV